MLRLAPALALFFAGTLAMAQPAATPPPAPTEPFVAPPAPGRLVDAGNGRRLHIVCLGDAPGPTVVFEAGLSGFTANGTYGPAQALIAPFARVCTYDRAGLAWSDRVPGPRSFDDVARDLQTLLHRAGVPGPYVLVGHSFGGLLVRRFAALYPEEVVGVVLADATNELSIGPVGSVSAAVAQIDAALATSRPGVPVVALPAGTPPEVGFAVLPEVLRTERDEFMMTANLPAEMRRPWAFGTLGNRPLIVLRRGRSAGVPGLDEDGWRAAQERLPELSSNSLLIVVDSGHVIPFEAPQVTADAVRRVRTAAIERRRVADVP